MPNACNGDDCRRCDANGRTEDDEPIPCDRCQAEERYWAAYFKGMPKPSYSNREEYIADMRDSGHGHMVDEWKEKPWE